MASINKLSVRGIRAFSPDDDEQVIEFCFPLTIIVGANGCGKTTIIESLKYAVTGSLPPGNKSGQAFVHDPKSVGQTVVKGNIKLRFTNRAGNSMVVVRSMEVTQRKATMAFKALDGILRTTDPKTGERVSMSHKCSELDRQIPNLMGVSKPILEHVVFCHQEDSSWPLMEGAVLKKRFDDIFDSTRYAKALEAIRQTRKEQAEVSKNLKAELAELTGHKHAAEGFLTELEDQNDNLDRIETEMKMCDEKIQEQELIMSKAKQIIDKVDTVQEEMDMKRNELDKENSVIAKTRSMLEEDWTEKQTEEQLKDMLRGFDDMMKDDLQKKAESETIHKNIQKEIKELRTKDVQLNKQKGKLGAEREAHERMLRERVQRMEEIAQKHGIELVTSQTQGSTGTTAAGGSATGTGPPASGVMGTQQSVGTISTLGGQSAATTTAAAASSSSSAAGGGAGSSQETVITISNEDMDAFQSALKDKENELDDEKVECQQRHQMDEDELMSDLGDMQARQKSIDNDRQRIKKQQQEATKALSNLQMPTSRSRVRKSDIEEEKRRAAKHATERDNAMKDPRKDAIPKEIRAAEEEREKLKRDIDDDKMVLSELRQSVEEQSNIDILKSQYNLGLENLVESLQENAFMIRKYNFEVPKLEVPSSSSADGGAEAKEGGEDKDDDTTELTAMETLAESVRDKYEGLKLDLTRATEEQTTAQKSVSEKAALLKHNQQQVTSLKSQAAVLEGDDRGVQRIQRAIAGIRGFETQEAGGTTVDLNMEPQALMEYLTERIGECTTDEDKPESISRTITKLKSMSKVMENNEVVDIICPCCTRSMNADEVQVFNTTMNNLADPINSAIVQSDLTRADKNRTAKANYERWRTMVSQSVNDYLDHARVTRDAEASETAVSNGETELKTLQTTLDEAKTKVTDLESESTELRQLVDLTMRLRDDANRLEDTRREIKSKKESLDLVSPNSGGRDLRTVEDDVRRKEDERETFTATIGRLNREMGNLNNRLALYTSQAAKADQLVKEKEAKFESEQKASVKRTELNETVAKCTEEDKKLQEQVAPLRQQILAKESDKKRMRDAFRKEQDRVDKLLRTFRADVQKLTSLQQQIDKYTRGNKEQELERLNVELETLSVSKSEKEKQLVDMEPELKALTKKVDDQERHKKTIKDNIDLIKRVARVEELNNEMVKLEEELQGIEGSDKCNNEYATASKARKEFMDKKARRAGRKSGIIDQIRGLKRKLKTREYSNIEERHRQAMIKHETTLIAVSDLDKYYAALDKALLRFHGMKIEDINKIIRELWTLTYKGEDISNIQVVSGQDTAAQRAARAYNYRVVMTKGNTQLDMRGRCSAGQRVLASIVIRLALAETFCLNCGVMALDEPTTNLDYENKRGLAIALAQIIASRAQRQTNFQLVIITHDEDFVSMMKNELSTQTGFDMPETYYQVSREEGRDGAHYSKINAIDWDEI